MQNMAIVIVTDTTLARVWAWSANEGHAKKVRWLPWPNYRQGRIYFLKKSKKTKPEKHCNRLSSQLLVATKDSSPNRLYKLDHLPTTSQAPDCKVPRKLPRRSWLQVVARVCQIVILWRKDEILDAPEPYQQKARSLGSCVVQNCHWSCIRNLRLRR